jgi:hypothetical protein
VFPSAWLGAALGNNSQYLTQRHKGTKERDNEDAGRILVDSPLTNKTPFLVPLCLCVRKIEQFFKRERVAVVVWAGCLVVAVVYGFTVPSGYDSAQKVNIALIQLNTDPWKGDMEQYRKNYLILKRLSDEALAAEPNRIWWYGRRRLLFPGFTGMKPTAIARTHGCW